MSSISKEMALLAQKKGMLSILPGDHVEEGKGVFEKREAGPPLTIGQGERRAALRQNASAQDFL